MKIQFFSLLLMLSFSILSGCVKDETGTIRFSNTSNNPYNLYINGASKGEFGGGTWRNIELDAGTYMLKAEQVSGFVVFPTVKEGEITISGGELLEWSFP